MLDYRRYTTFLEERTSEILTAVSNEVGLSEDDFQVNAD